MRSRIASATVGSPIASYQSATGGDVEELAEYLIKHGFLKKEDIDLTGSSCTYNIHMKNAVKNFRGNAV